MSRKKERSGSYKIILAVVLLLVCIAGTVFYLLIPDPLSPEQVRDDLSAVFAAERFSGNEGLDSLCRSVITVREITPLSSSFRKSHLRAEVSFLDISALTENMQTDMQPVIAHCVETAGRKSEVFNDDDSYRRDILDYAYNETLSVREAAIQDYMSDTAFELDYVFTDGQWVMTSREAVPFLGDTGYDPMPGFTSACDRLELLSYHYSLSDYTSPGPVPDPACFGVTDDPAEVQALIMSDRAQKLINGQTPDWNPDKELIPGSPIRYYLDDTILSIVWQESEHGAVGTFAETFIADASQFRRKLADDVYGQQAYYVPTQLAAQANAVVASSGDFYDLPDRVYGIRVYDGKVMGGSLWDGQTCYINRQGDMLFSYEGQFSSFDEAQSFVDDNGIMFSLCFGPVVMENGNDVTPGSYPLGEINDTYARCVLAQLGKLHYLTMTINVRQPDYFVYVTLRQAADSVIHHGCVNAYTLDGGQTGSIIINNELINPVQFGFERIQSDIIYFATAIPDEP